jgi:hypothetical protein
MGTSWLPSYGGPHAGFGSADALWDRPHPGLSDRAEPAIGESPARGDGARIRWIDLRNCQESSPRRQPSCSRRWARPLPQHAHRSSLSTGSEVAAFVPWERWSWAPPWGTSVERPGPAFRESGFDSGRAGVAPGLWLGVRQRSHQPSKAPHAGVIVGGASILWDIARAPHSARAHNDRFVRPNELRHHPSMGAAGMGPPSR